MPKTNIQTDGTIEHAAQVASSYGFKPLHEIDPVLYKSTIGNKQLTFDKAAILCAHNTSVHDPEPVLAYYTLPVNSVENKSSAINKSISKDIAGNKKHQQEQVGFYLHMSGSANGMSEVITIRTIATIISEHGAKVERVRINTIGDRDCRERFQKELNTFVKRRLSCQNVCMPEDLRCAVLEQPLCLFESADPIAKNIACEAPQPVHCLSERARSHLRNVLENLEQIKIPYEIDSSLFDHEIQPRVIFKLNISGAESSSIISSTGGRCDEYVTRLTGRRENATVQASITFKNIKTQKKLSFTPDKTHIQLIHLGWRAKLHGFTIVDILRRANIIASHTFDTSRITPQLSAAQNAGVKHIIIMGEREARDNTAIIRRLSDNSQQTVHVDDLLKTIRKLMK